jgi:hypothetical protein
VLCFACMHVAAVDVAGGGKMPAVPTTFAAAAVDVAGGGKMPAVPTTVAAAAQG